MNSKIFFILIMLRFLYSCGGPVNHDARFNPIVDQFVRDAAYFGRSVDVSKVRISFDDIHKKPRFLGFKISRKSNLDNAEAYCMYLKRDVHNDFAKVATKMANFSAYDYAVIKLDNSIEHKSAAYIESVIYHELGHCVLNLDHDPGITIMATSLYDLRTFRYWYIRELFNRAPMEVKSISIYDPGAMISGRPVYSADYEAFGEQIRYKLYFDEAHNKYGIEKEK